MRHPAIHFLVAGALIFVAARWIFPSSTVPSEGLRIVIATNQIAGLRSDHLATHGRQPTPEEMSALIDAAVVDEILYREAIALGFDRTDAVVERRLVQNMFFLGSLAENDESLLLRQARALGLRDGDPVIRRRLIQRMRSALTEAARMEQLTTADLVSYFEKHRELFVALPLVRISQIAFAGADAMQRATTVLNDLETTGAAADAAAHYGDAFLSGPDLPLQSERGLAKIFGPDLARESLSLPVGEWSGPLRSAYGAHLIWVHERRPARTPPFAVVREAVHRRLQAEREQAALRQAITRLRSHYHIEVGGQDD